MIDTITSALDKEIVSVQGISLRYSHLAVVGIAMLVTAR